MGSAKQRQRQHYIDVARLLGYTIVVAKEAHNWRYSLILPNGDVAMTNDNYASRMFPSVPFPTPIQWRFMWQAALAAIKMEGLDAGTLKPPRKDGARPSRVPSVLDERNKLERVRRGARPIKS